MAYNVISLYGSPMSTSNLIADFINHDWVQATSIDLGSPESEFYTLKATIGSVVTGSHVGNRDIVIEGYIKGRTVSGVTKDAIATSLEFSDSLLSRLGSELTLVVNNNYYKCYLVSPLSLASDTKENNKDFCKFQLVLRAFNPVPYHV